LLGRPPGQLYDVAWYVNHLIVVAVFSLMLFSLLTDYTRLLRREQVLVALSGERASELQATLDNLADAVFVLDPQANVVDANPGGLRLLGFDSKGEALRPFAEYQNFLRATRLDGRRLLPEEYFASRALRGETFSGFLARVHTLEDRELTLDLSGAPIRGTDNSVTGAVVVFRDVTELEWARTRVTVARVATAVAGALSLGDLVRAVIDEAGAALEADAVTLYAVDEERRQLNLLGQRNLPSAMLNVVSTLSFDSPALSARAIATSSVEILTEVSKAGDELEIPRELGQRFGFGSLVAVPLLVRGRKVGAMTYATHQIRQISPTELEAIRTIGDIIAVGLENARLFDETQSERSRLTAVIESSPEGILIVDAPTGRVALANRAAEEMIGQPLARDVSPEEFPKVYGLCHPDGRYYQPEEVPGRRALRGEVVLGEEMFVCAPSGQETPLLANAAPIRDNIGGVVGAVTLFQDISKIKELERQREEFISVIAHDLRTPITVIQGYAQSLRRSADRREAPEQEIRSLEAIQISAWRLTRMVTDLLDASRLEASRLVLQKEVVDLPTLASHLIERLTEVTAGHPVRQEMRGEVPPLKADPGRVEQILTNLLTNAAKFSPEGTEIVVAIESRENEVLTSVKDRGPGIPPEEIPRLFTRFQRVAGAREEGVPGLGLGLYITKGLVEAHGGRIWVESEMRKGTTFCFTLPAAQPDTPSVQSISGPSSQDA
ncbi:MAG: ATP-binding protein, partial [Chloroflexi bacterium]|nr:ATP-binding protein [Chloroflexota bacterium]